MSRHISVDVVVVGAGVGGLCAAKTFKELDPGVNLVILESRKTVGGVWAEECLLESVRTNNFVGTYEYSDFPMSYEKYGVGKQQHIPGAVVSEYLHDYAVHFDILQLVQFNTTVLEAEKVNGGWSLTTSKKVHDGGTVRSTINCAKMVICTGHFSKANPVSYPGVEEFGKPAFNHAVMRDQGPPLAQDPNVETVTVVGASKTGYDAVHYYASHGKKVRWVIRASGGGGIWMYAPWVTLGPLQILFESLATTRFLSWFSPCIWGNFDGFGFIRKFLHSTTIGNYLVEQLWERMHQHTVAANGYRTDEAIKDLEPTSSVFWNPRSAILNYPTDIHDYVRKGQVSVIKKDISRLSKNGTIEFSDGSSVQTDGLIAVTGWKFGPPFKFKPEGIEATLGIPTENSSQEEIERWETLNREADDEILHEFPLLARPPKGRAPWGYSLTPFRLYRGIASPGLTAKSDHCLAFINVVHCTYNFILAETQSLWTFAYFNNKIQIKEEDVYRQTALFSRFGKLRYPLGFSTWWPEFIFDLNPYADMLLTDLGLPFRRKATFLQEVFEGYTIHGYVGINKEWQAKQSDIITRTS